MTGSPSRHEVVGSENQDESMDEDGRPPEMNQTGSRLWVEKVQGSNGGGVPVPEKVLDDDFVMSRMSLEFPDGDEGEPVITIGKEVLDAMNGLYQKCMIVKVLGRHITIEALNRKLRDLWRPTGGMAVLDLPRQFFLVRFEVEEDYMKALSGEGLGKPLKVDTTTLRVERARFARICVEVNLKRPLKGTLRINGERYYVAYEGLQNICPRCGIYGHVVSACPKGTLSQVPQMISQVQEKGHSANNQDADGFTEVRRSWSRGQVTQVVFEAGGSKKAPEVESGERMLLGGSETLAVSNSFGGLMEETVVFEEQQNSTMREDNKKNEDSQMLVNQNQGVAQIQSKSNVGKGVVGNGGFRAGDQEKKSGASKSGKHQVVEGKNMRSSAPGRAGGVYTNGAENIEKPTSRQIVESVGIVGGTNPTGGNSSMGIVLQGRIMTTEAPTMSRRSGLWNELKDAVSGIDGPLVIGGDFNTILRLDERFTWRRGRQESTCVAKRLDRVLCCAHARLRWQEAIMSHLPFLSSDHAPLYLQLCPPQSVDASRRPFRFEAAWLSHEGFKELLATSWDARLSTPEALAGLKWKLKKWNKQVFGDIHTRKEKLVEEIKVVHDLLDV
ncbi:unnamed protein product, partial [Arabidopsis halleri]